MANPLSPSLVAAIAKRLIAPESTAQGGLTALRDMSRQARLNQQLVPGPRGELYMFPADASQGERATWEPMREMLLDAFGVPKGRMPTRKAADSSRLMEQMQDAAFPRSRMTAPTVDAFAAQLSPQGNRLEAASAWGASSEPDLAFLNKLIGGRGTGYEHLSNVLSGPLLPDASQVFFTPLSGARDFYKQKFGARFLSPDEAAGELDLDRAIRSVHQSGNASDLGVGIINRAEGGPVHLQAGGNDFRTPKHAGMSHTFSSAGEPYVNKYGTEMVPEKGANGKYYLRESAGVEAPMIDPMDPWMIPKTAPLSIIKKLAQMAKAVPESIAHGAQEFARASAPAYVKEEPLRRLMFRGRSDAGVQDNPSLFLAADKDHATYYANRRAAEVGGEPVVDSYLVNPFDGTDYGHGAPSDRFNDFQISVSRAKKLPLEDASLVRTDKVSPDLVRKADGGSVDRSPRIYTPTDGSPTTTGTRGLHDILQAMKEYHANA